MLQVLELHLEYPRPLLPAAGRRYKQAAAKMAAFMHTRRLAPGEVWYLTVSTVSLGAKHACLSVRRAAALALCGRCQLTAYASWQCMAG